MLTEWNTGAHPPIRDLSKRSSRNAVRPENRVVAPCVAVYTPMSRRTVSAGRLLATPLLISGVELSDGPFAPIGWGGRWARSNRCKRGGCNAQHHRLSGSGIGVPRARRSGKDQAVPHLHQDRQHLFCCQGCLDLFTAEPEKYLRLTEDVIVCPNCLGEKPPDRAATFIHAGQHVPYSRISDFAVVPYG